MIQETEANTGYKIGTAAKMAGISPNTIRTWMRRDYFTASIESESGERILSSNDLKRLIHLKSLIDLGDSIGRIAHLDEEALETRLSELKASAENAFSNEIPSLANLQAGFLAPTHSIRLNSAKPLFWSSKSFASMEDLSEHLRGEHQLSIILIDSQGRNPDEKTAILELAASFPQLTIVTIFDFMQRNQLKELAKAGVHLLRWPINSIMIERYLYSLTPTLLQPNKTEAKTEIPERLLSESQLMALSDSEPDLDCECPRHVSSLVSSLCAFEDYSSNCSFESEKDRELHDFLHAETAKARRIMELALIRLCREDGVEIPAP
ncbi:MerR family transcriptional regulator [Pelagicoccus albus]|uniref:MerR family transcriptional regulator n=1 Tax=Pelagicoccus albus TaxID=415222 RepID=A0A7X1E7J4_9BACT|nr:MerR family transcriptional regulator [Pelagicoccus albus]MBC2605344.1 MerR family transcriptional regulator [Pelagicoccus albus]